jgi:hypothetical protein
MGKREVSNLRFFFSKKYIYDVARWTLGGLGEAEKFTSYFYDVAEVVHNNRC